MPARPGWKPKIGTKINRKHPLARGLIGCWLFNESNGSIAIDASGNGYHGTLNNSPLWKPGNQGAALQFNGVNSALGTNVQTTCTAQPTDFTVLAWFLTSGGSGDARIVDKDYVSGFEIGRAVGTGVSCYLRGTLLSSISLPEGIWHQVVLTRAGTTATLYGDGGKVSSTATVSGSALSTRALEIGSCPSAEGYVTHSGLIGHVQFWGRALSLGEIQKLYASPFAFMQQPRLLAYLYAKASAVAALFRRTLFDRVGSRGVS
jgi:hypothetical protein